MNQAEITALAKGMVPFVREVVAEETAKAVEPLVARIAQLEARPMPERGEKGERGDVGEKGDRGDTGQPGDIGPPGPAGERGEKGDRGDPGERGVDGDRGERGEAGEKGDKGDAGEKGAQGDRGEPGQQGDKGEPGAQGEKGTQGDVGPPGPAGPPPTAERILEAILANPEAIQKAVAEHLTANPPPAGKDGQNGRDGVGLSGAVIDHEGALVLTMADGSVHKVGVVVRQGDRGQDGRGLDGIERLDTDRTFGLKFANGDQLEWDKPTLLDRYQGIWREGKEYRRGDTVQSRGSQYAAERDTVARPGNSEDWRLLVKAGRDGKDFRPAEPKPPAEPIRFS